MGGGKKQTIGYRYFFSLHMGLGRGPVNEIVEIRVGDIPAYTSSIDLKTSGQLITINKPDLFGGEKKEGGIQGPCYVYNGGRTQNLQPALFTSLGTLPSIAAQLGGDVPNFRGVVTLWFDGLVAAMNPYPKEWSFRVRRSDAGWWNDDPWYPTKAKIYLGGTGTGDPWTDPLAYANTAALLSEWIETPAAGYTWALATHPVRGTPAIKVSAPAGTSGTKLTKLVHTISGLVPGETYTYHRDLYVAGYSTIGSGWHYNFSPQVLVANSSGQVQVDVFASQSGTVPSNVLYYYDNLYLEGTGGGPIVAMNPAHMLYEVNTNPEWGRGIPAEQIDDASYRACADALHAEGMGLCIPWFRQENIKDFIPVIINHIGAVQYVDRETGKLTLRLIRADYDPDTLPLFTPDTGLLDIFDDDSGSEETAYNEIIIVGFDPQTKEDIQVRVQNLAAIQSQGEIISNTITYKGLPTRGLCSRVALRELKVQLPLRKMNVVLDRRGWRIAPGMPFRISHPEKGINNLILRAGECRDGTLTDGKITVKSVQDIFGMPDTDFIEPPASGWTPPSFTATPSPESALYEMNWRDFYLRTSTADQNAVVAGTSYIAIVAKDPPNVLTQGYDVLTKPDGGAYTKYSTVGFTNWLTLLADIGPLDTEIEVADQNIDAFMVEFTPGMVVLIDDEQLEFTTFDDATRLATVKRGVADTIPAAHLADATIWLIDDELGSDGQEYEDGEIVYGKALTRTSVDVLDESAATELSLEVNQRLFRPYPPGNVQVGGFTIYDIIGEQPEPVLTWTHRNRLTQGDVPVGHTEGSVVPEAGVTYNIRVYAEDGTTLLRETDVGAVDTWTYDATMQGADGNPEKVWIELESVRDGLASQFLYRFRVVIVGGWGYGWGENWGGV